MEGPCSSSWSDWGWIRLPPCTPHNPKEGLSTCPGSQPCATPLHLSVSSWLWEVFSYVKIDQSRHIPATRWCFYKQVPLSFKVQELPASRIFPFVPQLGTSCAGAHSLKARRAALCRRASLCPLWFAGVLFLAISGLKRPYYCALVMKAGSTRRKSLGPRHSFVYQRCPPTSGWPVPAPWEGISDIPLTAALARFLHSYTANVCLLTADTEAFVLYTKVKLDLQQ